MKLVNSLGQGLYTLCAQPRCLLCHMACSSLGLCRPCYRSLPWRLRWEQLGPYPMDCFSLFDYEWPIPSIIMRIKYQEDWWAAKVLGQLMALKLRGENMPDALVPVPLHIKRLGKRGYNQSLELAKPLRQRLGLPILAEHIVRTQQRRSQAGLGPLARAYNVERAFTVVKPLPLKLWFVDDVVATGHTVSSLAKCVVSLGSETPKVLCCAYSQTG